MRLFDPFGSSLVVLCTNARTAWCSTSVLPAFSPDGTSVVTGSFFVDPSTLHGECNFSMESVAGGLGEVSFNLYDMNWSQIGTFLGAVGGLSLAKVSGSGTITYY